MSVNKYFLKFVQLSKFSSTMIVDHLERMSKFVSSVSKMVFKECRTTMLINDIEIYRLMFYLKQIFADLVTIN